MNAARGLGRLARWAIAAVLTSACGRPSERGGRDFERMRMQQRYDAYEASRFFANGAVLQPPPAHTVPRDTTVAADAMTIGARHFAITCAVCHGAGGFGGGVMAANLVEKRPPSLRTARVAAMSDEMLVAVIADGFGRMPPFGWQLPLEDRRAVAAYVRALPTLPLHADARTDSARATYLARLDSLAGAGAGLDAVLRLRRGER